MSIHRRENIPDGFDLAKYEPVKNFDTIDWLVNLDVRTFCHYQITKATGSDWRDCGEQTAYKLIEAPIVVPDERSQRNSNDWPYSPHVHDFSVRDFLSAIIDHQYNLGAERIEPLGNPVLDANLVAAEKRREKYKQSWDAMQRCDKGDETTEDIELLNKALWSAFSPDLEISEELFLCINLDGTDEQIVEDFKYWLQSMRAKASESLPKKRVTQSDFDYWTKNRLLPYLDLKNWCVATKVRLSQQALGVALFPEEFDVLLADRLRRTIRPLARAVAHERFTDALRSQAKRDFSAQKITKSVPGKWDYLTLPESPRP